jgi:nucleoside-diphosphate-sugar epimerase
MSTRNVLVIGGSSPLGSQVVDAFRGNWRVVNLDREENGLVMDNILWSNENIE